MKHLNSYLCNRGESAFHAMMANYGWAKYPMIHRLPALRKDVPITFIYGARSWIDRKPGDCIKELRENSVVDVHVILKKLPSVLISNTF